MNLVQDTEMCFKAIFGIRYLMSLVAQAAYSKAKGCVGESAISEWQ